MTLLRALLLARDGDGQSEVNYPDLPFNLLVAFRGRG